MNADAPKTSTKWHDLGIRVISAAVLIPAVVADVVAGGVWFQLMVALVTVMMAYEWTRLAHDSHPLQQALHVAAALCGTFLPTEAGVTTTIFATGIILVLSVFQLVSSSGTKSFWKFAGIPYVSLSAAALVLLQSDEPHGALAIIWVFVAVWCADTLAYFAGRTIGGPKLAPSISPNKTWAGLAGAVAGGIIGASAVALIAGLSSIAILACVAGFLGLVEQGGDLFKSQFKRHFGVKDTGTLIPGHGGVIDRVDGLVAASLAAVVIGSLRAGAGDAAHGLLFW